MLEVHIRTPELPDRVVTSDKDSVMIGRAPGNDICIDVAGVSRYHARLTVESRIVSIEDLDSTNGVFVNSERVRSRVISPDDKIAIGTAVLRARLLPDVSEVETKGGKFELPMLDDRLISAGAQMPGKTSRPPVTANEEEADILVEGSKAGSKPVAPEAVERAARTSDDFYWQSLASFLGPIWKYQTDDAISEIMINGPGEIYVESKGQLRLVPEKFSPDELQAAVLNIAQYVGRRVSEEEPYLDARLPDGSRVAILLPPCSRKGTAISIRKFSKERLTLDKLIEFGSLTKDMVTFLKACVILKKNVIVSGGTSSGKTSLLNVVSGLIPADERIITIEDSAELQLSQDHVVPMETKPADKKGRGQVTIRDLVRASLRMRPDRIVVGEIRSGEALDLLQAMNTGHSGSMATVHASSPAQALTRLETLALFSGIEIPIRALREQVSTAIDIVIQAARLPDHSRKVTHISEVGRLNEDGTYQVNDVFKFNNEGRTPEGKIKGRHLWTGYVPSSLHEMELSGLADAVALFQQQ